MCGRSRSATPTQACRTMRARRCAPRVTSSSGPLTARASTPTGSTPDSGGSSPSPSPRSTPRSSSSAYSAATRAASASPIRRRSCARQCSSAPTRWRRERQVRASRRSSSCSPASRAACCPMSRVAARSGRAETSRRSHISLFRSSGKERHGSTATGLRARTRSRPRASSRRTSPRRRGSRSSTGRSSWPRTARSASCVRGGSRRPPTSRARSLSRRCKARARLPPADPPPTTAAWAGRLCGKRPAAPRRLGDQ